MAEFLSRLTNFENATIVSSPFLRASQTTAILAAQKNQTFCTDKRLEERDIVNNESNHEVSIRVASLIEELKSNYENIFLITHRLTMTALFNHYDEDFVLRTPITNPDVYTINFTNGEIKIERESMATPYVAGALALLLNYCQASDQFNRQLTEDELYAQLVKHIVPFGTDKSVEGKGLLFLTGPRASCGVLGAASTRFNPLPVIERLEFTGILTVCIKVTKYT